MEPSKDNLDKYNAEKQEEDDASWEKNANPAYALGQLARALSVQEKHPDAPTRMRAAQKVDSWLKVLRGMLSGAFQVGSRTPVADTPAWATLQVVHGGFATGDLLAAGALQAHEENLLARLAASPSAAPRAALNGYYLSDAGIAELQQMLQTGRYRISVPEEGALLVVAWLLAHDQGEAARGLLDKISPFLNRLRFYPLPTPLPLSDSTLPYLQTVGETIQSLQAVTVPRAVEAEREAALVWAPLSDRMAQLFLETVNGPAPFLQSGHDGKPVRSSTGQWSIEGGWPCQQYPPGWRERAQAVLADYRRLRSKHTLCGKPERSGENFALLRGFLETCVQDPELLTGRDVGKVRAVLAQIGARRGLPTSEQCKTLRQKQQSRASVPTHVDLARVVISRLAAWPPEEGMTAPEDVLAPITAAEANTHHLPAGQSVPDGLVEKVRRCLAAPAAVLVEQRIIPSGEVLARVIPQITAQVAAASFDDPDLRRLYGAVYQAFRRRRSLLLLNLQSQVKLSELPWVKSIEAQRVTTRGAQEQARQILEQIFTLAVTAFPQQILPNKLLQELQALTKSARIVVPLVEEVAADIFMGAFSEKFLRAAQSAAKLLSGTLYERYYGLSYARVLQIDDVKPAPRGGTPMSPAFFQLCSELAGPSTGGSGVARNGMILEQEQILTTHNLAALFTALELPATLQPRLPEMAQTCFAWTCRRLQQPIPDWQARLQAVKNAAYAWRQMIFFLSLVPETSVSEFLAWATTHLEQQRLEFQLRYQPALDGLKRATLPAYSEAVKSGKIEDIDETQRFLGWTTGTHWLVR